MFRKVLIFASICFALVLAAANIWLGPLNLDEGWYLNAALSVSSGLKPYRDFFFTQAPMLPQVYAEFACFWKSFGILGGRVLTAVFGLAAAFLAAVAVRASVSSHARKNAASLTVFLLLACNVYHSYFTVIPKTYALASFFLMMAFVFLSLMSTDRSSRKNTYILSSLGGLWLAAAAATRLSLGISLAIAGVYLLVSFKRYGLSWLFFGIGGLIGLGLYVVPDAMSDFEAFKFANFFHGARASGGLMLTVGSVSRLARNYMPGVLMLIASVATACYQSGRNVRNNLSKVSLPLLVFAGIFIVHALSPFPYDDYQVPGMTLLLCAISAFFWNTLPESADSVSEIKIQNLLLTSFLVVAVAFAGTSPLNESWVMIRKDRFWVEMKKIPDIKKLADVAQKLSEENSDSRLLTTDTYLAVQAGNFVPAGLEMGPFGYFPGLSDEEAKRFHVLNKNLLRELVESNAVPVAAFSGYAFSMGAPAMEKISDEDRNDIFDIISSRYRLVETIPDFGQEHTDLQIWHRK